MASLSLVQDAFLQWGVCRSHWDGPPLESWDGAVFTQ